VKGAKSERTECLLSLDEVRLPTAEREMERRVSAHLMEHFSHEVAGEGLVREVWTGC
jgi:hypothetical protein